MEKKYTAGIYTLGCRVNLYESEAITSKLLEKGFEIRDFSELNDVYIVNTCTVTAESDRKSRQMIRRALKVNPKAAVLVCGCYSQMFGVEAAKIDGVDYIGGTTDKMQIADMAEKLVLQKKQNTPLINIGDPFHAPFESMEATCQDRTRAFLKIEDGCNNKCSYCIIPKARGSVRSKPIEEVFTEVNKIVSNGYREIVLVGIETAAYGEGEAYSLIDLLEKLENVDGLERIRLGSLEPSYLKKDIIDRLVKLKKPMPHYHLSLQSGTDRTLNAMRRRYNTKMISEAVEYMRQKIPNVTFGADLIAGFPGETEEDHLMTLDFIEKINILNCHIFSYSVRPETEAAARKDQVEPSVKTVRHNELQALSEKMKKSVIEGFIETKKELDVLFEQETNGMWTGHTDNFINVKVKSDKDLNGCVGRVVLIKYNEKDGMTEGELK